MLTKMPPERHFLWPYVGRTLRAVFCNLECLSQNSSTPSTPSLPSLYAPTPPAFPSAPFVIFPHIRATSLTSSGHGGDVHFYAPLEKKRLGATCPPFPPSFFFSPPPPPLPPTHCRLLPVTFDQLKPRPEVAMRAPPLASAVPRAG